MPKKKSKRSVRREERRARAVQTQIIERAKQAVENMTQCLIHGHELRDVGEVYAVCSRCGAQGTKALRGMPLARKPDPATLERWQQGKPNYYLRRRAK